MNVCVMGYHVDLLLEGVPAPRKVDRVVDLGTEPFTQEFLFFGPTTQHNQFNCANT